ncbi:hypothetical protein [Sphingobium aromaticiconvertens]|uniref:hypothetical protein n=1 Tax=Sphingobium aromaticiconvertens TaxID=365341 RepID=UPI00301B0D74
MRSVLAVLLMTAAPALAQIKPAETPACDAAPRLADPWTSWPQSGEAVAGGEAVSAPRLILGKPVTATLRPGDYVHFPITPGKSGPQGHGGLFTLAVKTPARIGIALSEAAWVDVIKGTASIASVEHGHGPVCSGIRKIVWFTLSEGLHTIQIANARQATIRIMAADAAANR